MNFEKRLNEALGSLRKSGEASGSGEASVTEDVDSLGDSLANRLNKARIQPAVDRGVVTLVFAGDNPEEPVGFDGEGYVDAHPEGSDRGGYVPYWESGGKMAYHMENDGEWVDVW